MDNDEFPSDIGRLADNPFRPNRMTIYKVSGRAGGGKTRKCIETMVKAARLGRKIIIASPTNYLTGQSRGYAEDLGPDIKIYEITTDSKRIQYRKSLGGVAKRIAKFVDTYGESSSGLILFVTHEGFHRVTEPPELFCNFELIIDEEPETILIRKPLKFRYTHFELEQFIDINAVPTTIAERNASKLKTPPEFTANDAKNLATFILYETDKSAGVGEKANAAKFKARLENKKAAWDEWVKGNAHINMSEDAKSYYMLTAKPAYDQEDPMRWIKLRRDGVNADDVYAQFEPVPRWLLENAPLFTDMTKWNDMTVKPNPDEPVMDRGQITIIGFRRPEMLQAFKQVTIMGALFEYTFTHMVWEQLGVNFVPSPEIDVTEQKTHLGKRNLKIYWLYDQGWSKYIRNRTGGIEKVLELIKKSGVVSAKAKVCILLNKPDRDDQDPEGAARRVFPNCEILPHNSRGQNQFRHHNQLIFLPALNSYTPDIDWLETVLGISSEQQRTARTGQEAYQTAMRVNLRERTGTKDVTIIVADKDVALWFAQWFEPADQVSVMEIDSNGVISRKRGKGGRPKIANPLSQAERKRRSRAKKKQQQQDADQS